MENWENPAKLSDNLLPAHAVFSEEALSLGGKWRFLGLDRESPLPDGWTEPDFNDRKWDRINVPGTWDAEQALTPKQRDTGLYRRSFILSREQGSRQILLRFDALPESTVLWVNGSCIGWAGGMGMPCEFDITGAVRPDRNVICLLLRRTGDTKARFAGLPGDVTLYSLPARAITGLSVETCWPEGGSPLLRLSAAVRDADGFSLRIALMDGNRVLHYRECPVEDGGAEVLIPCPEVELWCAEHPRLYRVAVILWDGLAPYHTRELAVGFRNITRNDDGCVLINGQPEKMFAAEFNAVDPENGCFLLSERAEAQLSALRASHINSIRLTASAPDTVYALCDRLGLYILDCSAAQEPRHTHVFGCHPSVIAWNAAPEYPGILDITGISVLPHFDGSTGGLQTVLLSLPHSEERLEPVIQRVRESSFIWGAVFADVFSRLRELRSILQPVYFAYDGQKLTVTNLSRFRSTAPWQCRCRLTRDGETVVSRTLDLEVAPGQTRSALLETQYDIFRSGRYYLTAEYIHPETGELLADAQWEAGYLHHIFDENPGGSIREDQGSLILRSGDASFTVSRASGALEQILLKDRPMLAAPMGSVFAPDAVRGTGLLLADEWGRFSAGRKKPKPAVLEVDHMTRTVTASYKLGSGLIQNCRLFADGSMSWELRLRTGRTAPSLLGVSIPLDPKLDRFTWFGLGPDDARPEHTAGSFFGIHSQQGASCSPGVKDPVYHLTVTDGTGFGLHIRCENGLRASLRASESANQLRLELPAQEMKPHTTYTLSFTVQPVQA